MPALENGYYVFAAGSLLCVPFCIMVIHAGNNALEQRAAHASPKHKAELWRGSFGSAPPVAPMTPNAVDSFFDSPSTAGGSTTRGTPGSATRGLGLSLLGE